MPVLKQFLNQLAIIINKVGYYEPREWTNLKASASILNINFKISTIKRKSIFFSYFNCLSVSSVSKGITMGYPNIVPLYTCCPSRIANNTAFASQSVRTIYFMVIYLKNFLSWPTASLRCIFSNTKIWLSTWYLSITIPTFPWK